MCEYTHGGPHCGHMGPCGLCVITRVDSTFLHSSILDSGEAGRESEEDAQDESESENTGVFYHYP